MYSLKEDTFDYKLKKNVSNNNTKRIKQNILENMFNSFLNINKKREVEYLNKIKSEIHFEKINSFLNEDISKTIINSLDDNNFVVKQISNLDINIFYSESSNLNIDLANEYYFLENVDLDISVFKNKLENFCIKIVDEAIENIKKFTSNDFKNIFNKDIKENALSTFLKSIPAISKIDSNTENSKNVLFSNENLTELKNKIISSFNKRDLEDLATEFNIFLKKDVIQQSYIKINSNDTKYINLQLKQKNFIDLFIKRIKNFSLIKKVETIINKSDFFKLDLAYNENNQNNVHNEETKKIENEEIFGNLKYLFIAISVVAVFLILFILKKIF